MPEGNMYIYMNIILIGYNSAVLVFVQRQFSIS